MTTLMAALESQSESGSGRPEVPLRIHGLSVSYSRGSNALSDVSLEVAAGETVGVAGDSGSGKTTLGLAILGLLPAGAAVSGSVVIGGVERVSGRQATGAARRMKRDVTLISQETVSALNPVMKIGTQLVRVLRTRQNLTRSEARRRAEEWLGRVRIQDPGSVLGRYPHELSGGMCQRVNIAMALSCEPRVLVADEATTALDVAVQKEVLSLLRDLAADYQVATLLISHDLGVLHEMTTRLLVLYHGAVIESGKTSSLLAHPRHPYTRALVAAVPTLARPGRDLDVFDSSRLNEAGSMAGCLYQAHCPYRIELCSQAPPILTEGASQVRCWRAKDLDSAEKLRPVMSPTLRGALSPTTKGIE
jgi:oligopeptide/dipeptide ABC transporter ATP-binding protein